ncbi:glycosyltransferase [Spongisporangium articulatum]|uniref:Glycosyltransferase n=1 Tax=Spongisporangium articulatum TaxID=3362603 RepID=A0ABW8AS28_9ACTN
MADIVFFAYGSRGDVQPPAALGAELVARGHTVRMLAPARYAGLVEAAGLRVEPLRFDPIEVLASDAGQRWQAARDPFTFYRRFREVTDPLLRGVLDDAAAAGEGADLVLAPVMGGVGAHVAEAVGAANIVFHLQPGERTTAFCDPLLGSGRRLGPFVNAATHDVYAQASWALFRPTVTAWRRERLGLPDLPRGVVNRYLERVSGPMLGGFSPSVVPPPRDWAGRLDVTGFWFDAENPAPAPELVSFVAGGPPPVYVGFGSMVPAQVRAVARAVGVALSRLRRRVVMLRPPTATDADLEWLGVLGDDVLVVDEAPHAWLFPRCVAAVHHGGAGTLAQAVRGGVPQVLCPQGADQWFWARALERLGVAVGGMPLARISSEGLAARLRLLLDDDRPARLARHLAVRVGSEDGVRVAADRVERDLAGRRTPARRG